MTDRYMTKESLEKIGWQMRSPCCSRCRFHISESIPIDDDGNFQTTSFCGYFGYEKRFHTLTSSVCDNYKKKEYKLK